MFSNRNSVPGSHGSGREILLSSCSPVGAALIHTCFNLISHGYIPGGYPEWESIGLYAFTTDRATEKVSAFPSHALCYMEDIPSLFFRSTFCSGIKKVLAEGQLCLDSGE